MHLAWRLILTAGMLCAALFAGGETRALPFVFGNIDKNVVALWATEDRICKPGVDVVSTLIPESGDASFAVDRVVFYPSIYKTDYATSSNLLSFHRYYVSSINVVIVNSISSYEGLRFNFWIASIPIEARESIFGHYRYFHCAGNLRGWRVSGIFEFDGESLLSYVPLGVYIDGIYREIRDRKVGSVFRFRIFSRDFVGLVGRQRSFASSTGGPGGKADRSYEKNRLKYSDPDLKSGHAGKIVGSVRHPLLRKEIFASVVVGLVVLGLFAGAVINAERRRRGAAWSCLVGGIASLCSYYGWVLWEVSRIVS